LRGINEVGVHNLWASVIWFTLPTILLLPVTAYRWQSIMRGGMTLQITVILSGFALLCYSLAFLYTDVIRAIMLYYLTPVWSTLIAAVVLKEMITLQRIIAIILAFMGMLIMFGLGVNFPVPKNLGDWMGLLAGIIWAIAIVRIRKYEKLNGMDLTIGFFFWGMIAAFIISLIIVPEYAPSWPQITSTLPWLMPFIIIFLIPGAFTSLWGPKYVSPGLAGLLMMIEIPFGTISATIFADEIIGSKEMWGIVLITSAGLIEPVYDLFKNKNKHTYLQTKT
jgi:drug/metabolite transporter (DMT)-like permease